MHANTWTLYNAKVGTKLHDTLAPMYKGLKKELCLECKFWFCVGDIIHYVGGNNKAYVLDWPIVPSTWLVKIGTNLSREEVLALSPHRRLSTIVTLPILWLHICVLPNRDAHPTSEYVKTPHCTPQ
jgi:hypothetical protein